MLICLPHTFCECFPATEARWVIAFSRTVVRLLILCRWLNNANCSHTVELGTWSATHVTVLWLNNSFQRSSLCQNKKTKVLVKHNGVWVLLLLHYMARCCVVWWHYTLCLKTTVYISGPPNHTQHSSNIPKSKGRVRKIGKFKIVYLVTEFLFNAHKKKKKKRIQYQNWLSRGIS